MHGFILIDAASAATLLTVWYLLFLRYNRRRSKEILQRLRGAFAPQAQIMSVRWMGSSQFTVRLRVVSTLFQQATLQVRMHPRQIPFLWMWERLKRQQEQMTFEADLECPPGFNLEVQNHRWCGRTRNKLPRDLRRLALDQCGPFVLTTRNDWQREITAMMSALVASRDCDFLSVNFRRTSPHFSATLPLFSVAQETGEAQFFDVLQELASCAQVTKF